MRLMLFGKYLSMPLGWVRSGDMTLKSNASVIFLRVLGDEDHF